MRWVAMVAALAALLCAPAQAVEIVILTGPEGSVEHEEIGPRIADVIRPVAERHPFDVHGIRLEPSTGTAETLARCGRETRTLCLGIARAGVPVDLPEERRPRILRSDLDRACPVFFSPGARFWTWTDLRRRASEARFVVRPGSDAEGLLRTWFRIDPALSGVEPRIVHAPTRWPSDILDLVARTQDGIGLDYGYPDPEEGLVPRAAETGATVFGMRSAELVREQPGFERVPRTTVWKRSRWSEDVTVDTLCAPMMLVSSDPERLSHPAWDEVETWHRRRDLEDMLAEIEWALAAELRIGPPAGAPGSICERLGNVAELAAGGRDAAQSTGDLLRALGIRAVTHSSGRWIVTSGGAYVAGTLGVLGTTVAVVTGPVLLTAGTVITVAGIGVKATCTLGAR